MRSGHFVRVEAFPVGGSPAGKPRPIPGGVTHLLPIARRLPAWSGCRLAGSRGPWHSRRLRGRRHGSRVVTRDCDHGKNEQPDGGSTACHRCHRIGQWPTSGQSVSRAPKMAHGRMEARRPRAWALGRSSCNAASRRSACPVFERRQANTGLRYGYERRRVDAAFRRRRAGFRTAA
jgi:hypothetical protein